MSTSKQTRNVLVAKDLYESMPGLIAGLSNSVSPPLKVVVFSPLLLFYSSAKSTLHQICSASTLSFESTFCPLLRTRSSAQESSAALFFSHRNLCSTWFKNTTLQQQKSCLNGWSPLQQCMPRKIGVSLYPDPSWLLRIYIQPKRNAHLFHQPSRNLNRSRAQQHDSRQPQHLSVSVSKC